jgi:outer membrane lipoprotein-sorting protein
MKRLLFCGVVLILSMTMLAGCRGGAKPDGDIYERIQRRLLSLETFKAEATVTYVSNKNTHIYETTQYARVTGAYRVEVTGPERVAGNITVFDGRQVAQINESLNGKVILGTTDSPERYEILLTSFIRNYVRSRDVSVAVASVDGNIYTVLEANLPGTHPYLSTEKLWVCNQTLDPFKLVIYDNQGTERIIIEYKAFEFNPRLDEKLFMIE